MSDILSSKKFWAATIAVITALASSLLGLSETQVGTIVAPIVAYILGQGVADKGKEAEKIKLNSERIDAPGHEVE